MNPTQEVGSAQKSAVIYLRVSTKEQAERNGDPEGYSIPAQRDACRRKAQSLEATVIREFVDRGESAKTADRPALKEMLSFIASEPIACVIVHKVDRLARNRADDVLISLQIEDAGAALVSCSENIDETPSGTLLHGIMSSIAEFYSRNLAQEALKGMTQKAMAGGTAGKAPIGYRNVGTVVNGREARTVEVDPDRGPLVAWAFEEYATGQWSMLALLNELTARGLRTMATAKRTEKPLSPSRFHALLRSRYYLGKIIWKDVEYDGLHAPLVSQETFDRVQEILTAHNTAGERQVTHLHYLKGSVFCGKCRSRLCVTFAHGRGGIYPYFICLGRHGKRTGCLQKALPISAVEGWVEEGWGDVKMDPDYAEFLQGVITEEIAKQQEAAKREATLASRRLRTLTAQREKLLQAHYAGAVPLDLLRSDMKRIESGIEGCEKSLRANERRTADIQRCLDLSLRFLSDYADTYKLSEPAMRRQLNQGVFEGIFVSDDVEGYQELSEPFQTFLSPRLIVDTRPDQSDQASATWARGMPSWLREHPSWSEMRERSHRTRGLEALGLGLNKILLAAPTGFEPVSPP
jgi:DNA invertase Pin-like site-specific DNA recombinase